MSWAAAAAPYMSHTPMHKCAVGRSRAPSAVSEPQGNVIRFAVIAILVMLQVNTAAAFDLQGHRGARGLAPENTLPGFARAVAIGVTTLETDLAVTRDGVLVLSHDPALNRDITRLPDGRWLTSRRLLIRDLTFDELGHFDVGRTNPGSAYGRQFPAQASADGARIPALTDLFALGGTSGRPLRYNLEIKTSPLHPADTIDPLSFARLLVDVVHSAGFASRVTIQSFDWRTILETRRLAPEIATSCLTMDGPDGGTIRGEHGGPSPWLAGVDRANPGASVPRLAAAAGCRIWSPYWRNLDRSAVSEAHGLGLEVIPWTVNRPDDIEAILDFGVDGLITDYPDIARSLLDRRGLALR